MKRCKIRKTSLRSRWLNLFFKETLRWILSSCKKAKDQRQIRAHSRVDCSVTQSLTYRQRPLDIQQAKYDVESPFLSPLLSFCYHEPVSSCFCLYGAGTIITSSFYPKQIHTCCKQTTTQEGSVTFLVQKESWLPVHPNLFSHTCFFFPSSLSSSHVTSVIL